VLTVRYNIAGPNVEFDRELGAFYDAILPRVEEGTPTATGSPSRPCL